VKTRSAVLAAALGALAFVPSVASGAVAGDSVVGFTDDGVGRSRIDVRSGPSGEAPTGTFQEGFATGSNGRLFRSTSISCLAVNGTTAFVGAFGVLDTRGTGPNGEEVRHTFNTGVIIVIRDNGTPEPGPFGSLRLIDEFRYDFVDVPDCRNPNVTSPPFWSFGDFTVVDAPSTPTSKDQCKNGGFALFGFKNQGECVAFVQRGPKPKP
jgi:hypothetical protein